MNYALGPMRGLIIAVLLVVAGGLTASAHEKKLGDLTVTHPWARPNLPNRPTAAYLTVANGGTVADRLTGASSPAFGRVEMHKVTKENGVMSMSPVGAVSIEPGDAAVFEPGSYHLMLFDAARLFKEGETFPLTLDFEKAGELTVTVKVMKGAGMDHSGHSGSTTGTN